MFMAMVRKATSESGQDDDELHLLHFIIKILFRLQNYIFFCIYKVLLFLFLGFIFFLAGLNEAQEKYEISICWYSFCPPNFLPSFAPVLVAKDGFRDVFGSLKCHVIALQSILRPVTIIYLRSSGIR